MRMNMAMWTVICFLSFLTLLSHRAHCDATRVKSNFEAHVVKFYMHDNLLQKTGNTAFIIAGPGGNTTTLQQGSLVAINDLITEKADPLSRQLGKGQGVYLASTFKPEPHVHLQFTAVFTDKYKGTIAYQGDDNVTLSVREIAVVGGTGQFRSATGYCFIRSIKQTDTYSYILKFESHLFVPTFSKIDGE